MGVLVVSLCCFCFPFLLCFAVFFRGGPVVARGIPPGRRTRPAPFSKCKMACVAPRSSFSWFSLPYLDLHQEILAKSSFVVRQMCVPYLVFSDVVTYVSLHQKNVGIYLP